MDKIKDKFFNESDEFIAKMKGLPKCELCDYGYMENYEEGESMSVEEYENLTTEGRCTGCIEEYGTDSYPDR